MQEEVTQKSIALVIRTSKLTADVPDAQMGDFGNRIAADLLCDGLQILIQFRFLRVFVI